MLAPKEIRIEPLGEAAFLLRSLGEVPAHSLARALTGCEEIEEATPAYETVGVYTNGNLSEGELRELLSGLELGPEPTQKLHKVPVCYELGPDLEETAGVLNLTTSQLVELHSSQIYKCYAVGFSPGFPFLGYLPEALQGVARRPSPRQKVPIGSVGITGRQTGIYPSESPGGWALIGRTPLCLSDLADAYFPISAGDKVRFVPIDSDEFENRLGERL